MAHSGEDNSLRKRTDRQQGNLAGVAVRWGERGVY